MESKIIILVENAKKGDTDAFSMLYQIFYPKMKGICIKILKEDKDDVDDLVQDAFILALATIKNLKNSQRFSQWLTSITTNLALKYQEKNNKVQFISLATLDEATTEGIEEEVIPESTITYDKLMAAIEELPEGYKKVFKMYVLDGLSHQEIAAILNIAPHTSSSQLARAKVMLKGLLDIKTLAVLILTLIGIPIYKNFLNKKPSLPQKETSLASHRSAKKKQENKVTLHNNKELPVYSSPKQRPRIIASNMNITVNHDTTQTSIILAIDSIDNNRNITKNYIDTIFHIDSIFSSKKNEEYNYIVEYNQVKKTGKWHIMTLGSLGTSIIQNTYKMITGKDNSASSGQPSEPKDFTTWEDYAQYLHRITPSEPTQENLAMEEIADHNQGKIIESEHHNKPITIGIAVNKRIGGKFSIETGLKYSFLKSDFRLGTGNYFVDKEQKLHYLGIPLNVSYQLIRYKKLSAYSSAGITLHIPIFGKTTADYITDGISVYANDWKVTPPTQWTTNISLGIQYQFAPNVNLFVEPTLNWYIPNGSNIKNSWTEHPFTFTVPIGIRFTW